MLEFPIMVEAFLVPENTTVTAKGDGAAVDISAAQSRVFLLTLSITNVIEQESLDLGIFGSSDGATWEAKALGAFHENPGKNRQPNERL